MNFLCYWCFKNYPRTALSNEVFWDEFSEQQKKHHIQCPICTFLVQIRSNLMHILIGNLLKILDVRYCLVFQAYNNNSNKKKVKYISKIAGAKI